MCPGQDDHTPVFRRATADDAVALAIRTFEAGERVDMAQLARSLGVGRSTLYRWVGDREHLMDLVIDATTRKIMEAARSQLAGQGLERTLSGIRNYLEITTAYKPLKALAEREPGVALHIMMDPEGVMASNARGGLRERLAADLPHAAISDELIDVLSVTAFALVWAGIAGGFEPQVDRTIAAVRALITANVEVQPRGRGGSSTSRAK